MSVIGSTIFKIVTNKEMFNLIQSIYIEDKKKEKKGKQKQKQKKDLSQNKNNGSGDTLTYRNRTT